jgi:hypothetical protein
LSSRVFKVKHKETGKYWQGYGSNYSTKGKEFTSALIAARQIDITRIRTSIPGQQLKDLVEIEEISTTVDANPIQTIPAEEALAVMQVHDHVREKYGYSFFCLWHKVATQTKYEGAKYLVKVKTDYETFRERLKGLGYSSRHFSKIKDWLVIYDNDVAMRIKLIEGYDEFIVLQEILDGIK